MCYFGRGDAAFRVDSTLTGGGFENERGSCYIISSFQSLIYDECVSRYANARREGLLKEVGRYGGDMLFFWGCCLLSSSSPLSQFATFLI